MSKFFLTIEMPGEDEEGINNFIKLAHNFTTSQGLTIVLPSGYKIEGYTSQLRVFTKSGASYEVS